MARHDTRFSVSLQGDELTANLTIRGNDGSITSADVDPDTAMALFEELGLLDDVAGCETFELTIHQQTHPSEPSAKGSEARLLNIREVAKRLNISVRTVLRMEREDASFPVSRRISKGRIGWIESEIEKFISNAPTNKPSIRRE